MAQFNMIGLRILGLALCLISGHSCPELNFYQEIYHEICLNKYFSYPFNRQSSIFINVVAYLYAMNADCFPILHPLSRRSPILCYYRFRSQEPRGVGS